MSPNSIASNPLPTTPGGFKAVEIDFPWHYRSYSPPHRDLPEQDRSVERHYKTMTMEDILAFGAYVDAIAAKDAHLFLWGTWPLLFSMEPVIKACGFTYSGLAFNWIKLRKGVNEEQLCQIGRIEDELHMGLGHTIRKNSEYCLLARRGNARRNHKGIREPIVAEVPEEDCPDEVMFARLRRHSEKPDETYHRIERYCDGPYISVFSRKHRPNWTTWGDEDGKHGMAA